MCLALTTGLSQGPGAVLPLTPCTLENLHDISDPGKFKFLLRYEKL